MNVLYEKKLLSNATRYGMPHAPLIINKTVMVDLQAFFPSFFELTSGHKKRQKNDMQTQFSYAGWLFEAPKSEFVQLENSDIYKSTRIGSGDVYYMPYWNDMKKNQGRMKKFVNEQSKSKKWKFLCVNDLMEHEKPQAKVAKKNLANFYKKLYPKKSVFEL